MVFQALFNNFSGYKSIFKYLMLHRRAVVVVVSERTLKAGPYFSNPLTSVINSL